VPTTNIRRPIDGSKDADFRLVFSSKRNKKLPLGVGAQGPMTWEKNNMNLPLLWRNPQKNSNLNLSNFILIETTRLSASFEDLNSSLAQSAGNLWLAQVGQIPVVQGLIGVALCWSHHVSAIQCS